MVTVFLILAKTVQIILDVVMLAMFVRMLMPLFFDAEGNLIYSLSCFISEPFIVPVRFLMTKLNVGQGSPIDWSFFATYLILSGLQLILPAI